jgi:hypothetical protein
VKQFLIALDQLANTIVWAEGEGFGTADETISARAWRLRERKKTWGRLQLVLDHVFFWDRLNVGGELAHCYLSWEAEFKRHHLPAEYARLSGVFAASDTTGRKTLT